MVEEKSNSGRYPTHGDLLSEESFKKKLALRSALIFAGCLVLLIVTQILGVYLIFPVKYLPISSAGAANFIIANTCMLLAVLVLISVNLISHFFKLGSSFAVLTASMHLGTFAFVVFSLFHIHNAGSQNSLLILMYLAIATGLQATIGMRAVWFYYALMTTALFVMAYMEYSGIISYAPLLTLGLKTNLRGLFLSNFYILHNMVIYLMISFPSLITLQVFVTIKERREKELLEARLSLEKSKNEIKQLKKLLPVCSVCKKVRDDKGYWKDVAEYIQTYTETEVTHGICPDCVKKHYPDIDIS